MVDWGYSEEEEGRRRRWWRRRRREGGRGKMFKEENRTG